MGVEQKRAAIEMTHSRHAISELEGVSSQFSVLGSRSRALRALDNPLWLAVVMKEELVMISRRRTAPLKPKSGLSGPPVQGQFSVLSSQFSVLVCCRLHNGARTWGSCIKSGL